MVKKDAAFSTENAKGGRFVVGVQSLDNRKEGNPEAMPTNQAPLESERSKEHFEDTDNLYRTALMDCYNG